MSPTRDIKGQCPSAAVCCRQLPPLVISKASAPVGRHQHNPSESSKASAPVRRSQHPPPGLSKASAPVCHRQYLPPGILKASAPVCLRQHPTPGISLVGDIGDGRLERWLLVSLVDIGVGRLDHRRAYAILFCYICKLSGLMITFFA
ncbi:hypothetical protein PoB_003648400 [Plakobranchus ocellatus]|uniref:Uncharacterized protein n=1 Tax=Plakobranchus ocellatus TaxID=259542 RepID=A0AAV4AQB3_9GAST|nr:hypothetical protein PoB_003648400 [Plakobranchus ocellatus]